MKLCLRQFVLVAALVVGLSANATASSPEEAREQVPPSGKNSEQESPSEETSEQESQREVFPGPEIVVSARRVDAPPSVVLRQVTEEDIDAWNAQTLGDALVHTPGLNVLYGGTSGDAKIWIRGFRDRDVLMLFNGVPIAQSFDGTFDLNEVALENIATVNVVKSAPSVIYGTNGLGGVVDVVPDVFTEGSEVNARLELGSDERRLVRATARGGDSRRGYSLSVQHQSAGDYSLSGDFEDQLNQPEGDRVNSDFERNNLLLHGRLQSDWLGTTSAFVNLSGAEKGLPVEVGVEDPDFERLTGSQRQTYGLSNQFETLPLSVTLFHNRFDAELTVYEDAGFENVDEIEESEEQAWGVNLYSPIELADHSTLIFSGSWKYDDFSSEGAFEQGNDAELTTYTLAAENQYWINEQLSLAAGLIYVRFEPESGGSAIDELNPQIALAWQLSPAVRLHASAAQRTRFPKMRELYRRRYGNPELDPQTADNYEIGVSFTSAPGLTADLSLFRSDIDGLIERPDRRSIYQNLDDVTFAGVESAVSGWMSNRLFARLAYTYLEADEALPGGGNRQLRSRPEHTVQAELRYRFGNGALVSVNGVYIQGLHDLDADGVYLELPSFFVADAKLTVPFKEHYALHVNVANIGDTDYSHRYGFPREGRSAVIGLNLGF